MKFLKDILKVKLKLIKNRLIAEMEGYWTFIKSV